MTPEEQRTERARQQVTASTSTPPTGIEPPRPASATQAPYAAGDLPPRQPLTGVQIFFAVFFGVLMASVVWSLLRRIFWEAGWGLFF